LGLAKQASILDPDSATGAAADRIATDGDAAGATGVTAGAQGIAARLQHAAASVVSAAAGNAATVLGQLALGMSTAKVALEYNLTIPQTAAVADTPLEHLAEILKSPASDIIIAAAGDLQTTFTLLKSQRASRKNARIPNHRRWIPGGRVIRIGGITIHQNSRHGVPPPLSRHAVHWQTLHLRWRFSGRLYGRRLIDGLSSHRGTPSRLPSHLNGLSVGNQSPQDQLSFLMQKRIFRPSTAQPVKGSRPSGKNRDIRR
jgi:hypothetical protein